MLTCLKLTDAAALALHSVDYISAHPDRLISNQEIADNLEASTHHLAKVHQWLVRAGILMAVRGPHGGFRLARDAKDIRLIDVIEAVEGPYLPSNCLLGRSDCLRESCILGELTKEINRKVLSFFMEKTAADLHGSLEPSNSTTPCG